MKTRKRILLICGSMNQTTMMTQIAQHLKHYDLWFTPHYTDGILKAMEQGGMLEWTVAGLRYQQRVTDYLKNEQLQIDLRGEKHEYDLVVTCADLVVPKNIRHKRIVLVQEGMTDPENFAFFLVKYFGLPRYIASTSTFGMSDAYVRICVASEGYRAHFLKKGVRSEKIAVTGIPNFDNCAQYKAMPFEHQDFVLVATSDSRETFKYENRKKFIRNAQEIADGRKLIFKLHPNELIDRAMREIDAWAPEALVYHSRDINPMIAHCNTLITRFSTVVYIGIALGKKVFSEFSLERLYEMCPMQNGGRSSWNIAQVCEDVLSRPDVMIPNTKWTLAGRSAE